MAISRDEKKAGWEQEEAVVSLRKRKSRLRERVVWRREWLMVLIEGGGVEAAAALEEEDGWEEEGVEEEGVEAFRGLLRRR